MFKHYHDLSDVVSLLPYCPLEKSFLLAKDSSGELWLPTNKCENHCWKSTAQKINFDIFGTDSEQCSLLRINKVWLPTHKQACLYHVVYKVSIKADIKKKTKIKGIRARLQWYTATELERQKAHNMLRSPELTIFTKMAVGISKDEEVEFDTGPLLEICDENVILASDSGAGAVSTPGPHFQLVQSAGYTKDDQLRLYRQFLMSVFPAVYMSLYIFTQFMIELGFDKTQGPALFRSADVSGRGGLSFMELVLWCCALEPATQHSGLCAELRCRYIFRYFDGNHDLRLEYTEVKELVVAARGVRQQPTDTLSVVRDTDNLLKQLGLQANSSLSLADFLRAVSELRIRGTSQLLRSPKPICTHLKDSQMSLVDPTAPEPATTSKPPQESKISFPAGSASSSCVLAAEVGSRASARGVTDPRRPRPQPDYCLALYTVRLASRPPAELYRLNTFDEEAVSASAARLVVGPNTSLELLAPDSAPAEALAAVRFFALSVPPIKGPRPSVVSGASSVAGGKAAWSWAGAGEAAALGALLLRLAEAVRPAAHQEPRLLRIQAPVYIVGDLHGNLAALLAMESALWPAGPALAPARLLFLGDYVDRGAHGTELLAYLFAAKIQRPNGVFLIRGNHECRDIQKMFTFYNECVNKYGDTDGGKIWSAINNVFDVLPLAAVVDDKVFCCHGGIPPPWVCPLISAIDKVPSPLPRPAEQSSLAWELLWNDPVKQNRITASLSMELAANEGFAGNAKRGTGHVFDQSALDRFLLANQLSHVVRAHELHQHGFMCQLRGRLVSVFSSSWYCGGNNEAGVALLEGGKLRLIRIIGDYQHQR